ncbi:ATP-dependent DNA helicase PIF1 isoform X2 [Anabrus simplex]|uniref:ATP-dependent DNA helicase PIF1 isoform X2 n=1 Tax=Anabrus simplex TaxID=316456 RepID=UPI0034DCCEE6
MSLEDSGSSSTLVCSLSLEWLNADRSVHRRANFKTVTLRLIRNEYREIFLEVNGEKTISRKFHLKGISVHKKFMSEGKASINFLEEKLTALISNAPPMHLMSFLKHMYIKLSGKEEPKVGLREQLLTGKPHVVEEISPVTLNEVNKAKEKLKQTDITPPTGKKKRPAMEIQNKAVKRSCLSTHLDPSPLTAEQKEILQAALSGKSIFFTGSAGTGKSYLLRRIIGALPPDVTVATASTGVAACHIGGITLHAFAGVGSGSAPVERCIELASRPVVQQAWRKCRHLIIDEVSMVEGQYFEKLEKVARAVRKNDRPFGGIQLILCGDFLQLPPVTRNSKPDDKRFCFQSSVWDNCIYSSYELTQVHRQSDPAFIDILQNVRIGRVTPEITEKLLATSKQKIDGAGILATRLCSHMQDVNLLNISKLEQLSGSEQTFSAVDSDLNASNQLDQQTPVPSSLKLKIGAQVMLMKNLNVGEGLVNGARGVVTKFSKEGLPVVRFRSKLELAIKPERWVVKTGGGSILTRKQLPLRLAWAFSIHKSQSGASEWAMFTSH